MIRKFCYVSACVFAGITTIIPASAQNTSRFNFNIGGGFTEPVGPNARRLDTGFNIAAGGGLNLTPKFGLVAEFGYNHFDLSSLALDRAGVPDGSTRVYSVTLNPIFRINPRGRVDGYIMGGGGFYRRTIEFTQPTVSVVNAFDPFYGIFFPAAIPTNLILGSFTQNKGGLNIGAGISARIRGDSNAKVFVESRYHYVWTTPGRTTYMPVTFGFRW